MFDKDSLHHAYFIEGDRASVLAEIESFLKSAFGLSRHGHPDVHYSEYESFGIEESRGLQDMQSMRPVMGDRKIFIIAAGSMTSEAQNALLKVFEEPTPGTHFFVIASSRRMLLPTLASRMIVVAHQLAAGAASRKEASVKEFMQAPVKERLALVQEMIEEKDKARAEEFLQALLAELHTMGKTRSQKELVTLIGYLRDRAPSLKLVLERAALLNL